MFCRVAEHWCDIINFKVVAMFRFGNKLKIEDCITKLMANYCFLCAHVCLVIYGVNSLKVHEGSGRKYK